jgi:hypothetical protein
MAAKLTKLTHKIAIQMHLVAESCTICVSRSRHPVRKLLDTPSYLAYSTLLLRSRVLENLVVIELVKKYPPFMEPEIKEPPLFPILSQTFR